MKVVADALLRGSDICLASTCHDLVWDATAVELKQIREYLDAESLNAHRRYSTNEN
jgi:hypothetical protein